MAVQADQRVKVTNSQIEGYNQTATVKSVVGNQIFLHFDGHVVASMRSYQESDLQVLDQAADGRRGGRAVGRFKR